MDGTRPHSAHPEPNALTVKRKAIEEATGSSGAKRIKASHDDPIETSVEGSAKARAVPFPEKVSQFSVANI
jgi:hypothetical protein